MKSNAKEDKKYYQTKNKYKGIYKLHILFLCVFQNQNYFISFISFIFIFFFIF